MKGSMTIKKMSKAVGIAMAAAAVFSSLPPVWAGGANPGASSNVLAKAAAKIAEADRLAAQAATATGGSQEAMAKWADALRVTAAAMNKQGVALGTGDAEAVKAAEAEVKAASRAEWCAGERLTVQKALDRINTSENLSASEVDKPLLHAHQAARQTLLEVGKQLLAALTPEASDEGIENARAAWVLGQDEVALTKMALDRANERAALVARSGVADSAVAGKLAELAKIDEEYVAAQRAIRDQQRQGRALERKREASRGQLKEAIKNAPRNPPQADAKP